MDPAENQQMIIFRQVMQCLDDGIESLVAAEKAEDPDQLAPARDVIEHRKFLPGCRAPNIRHFGGRQKRQGMVIHIPHAVCEFHLPKVAAGMHDQRDGLEALSAPQPAGQPSGQQVLAIILRLHGNRPCEIALQNLSEVLPVIERLALEHRVECHREPRSGAQEPRKPPMNVVAVSAQCAMLELQIDRVVLSYFEAYIQNVRIAEFSDAAMRAAEQILIQVEYRNLENVIQLLLQTTRISRDSAQIVVGRNQGQPFASAADVAKWRGRDRRRRQEPRASIDFERRHDVYRCSRTVWTITAPISQPAKHRNSAMATLRNRRG